MTFSTRHDFPPPPNLEPDHDMRHSRWHRSAFRLALTAALLCTALDGLAQATRYVIDELHVPLRSGQGTQYRILSMMRSGTALTVLESGEEDSWSRVRTSSGQSGWVETQYLTSRPVAAQRLKQAESELARLRSSNEELRERLQSVEQAHSTSSEEVDRLLQEHRQVVTELEELQTISANTVKIDRDNKELLQTNEMLRNELEVLNTDNQRLRDSRESEAFLNGAIAVVIGVIIALVVPRLRPRKRSEWA